MLTVWVMKHGGEAAHKEGLLRPLPASLRKAFGDRAASLDPGPGLPGRLRCLALAGGPAVGTELFPQVDSGQFVIRFRAPPGSEYELTRKFAVKVLDVIDQETQGNVAISMGYVGLAATNTATNNMLLFMRGTDDVQMRVRLEEGSGLRLADLRERLRKTLPEQLVPWLKEELQREGCPPEEAEARAKKISFGFEPGDIVSEVMSFGSPTPVEVVVAGPELGRCPRTCAEGPRGDEEDTQPSRRAALPATRLSHGRGGHRPRESRPERRGRQGRHRRAVGGDFFQPLRGQELLARPEDRRRLPGPGPGPHPADEPAAAGGNPAARESQSRHQPDGPRRGHGADRHDARRDRPQSPCSAI